MGKFFKTATIVKKKGKYYLYSKDGAKKLGGPYDNKADANKRERQIWFFKHKGKHG